MHACALFKVRAWGENVKWPSWGHQIFSYPSLSANHLPEILRVCTDTEMTKLHIGSADQTTDDLALLEHTLSQTYRRAGRQTMRAGASNRGTAD